MLGIAVKHISHKSEWSATLFCSWGGK